MNKYAHYTATLQRVGVIEAKSAEAALHLAKTDPTLRRRGGLYPVIGNETEDHQIDINTPRHMNKRVALQSPQFGGRR